MDRREFVVSVLSSPAAIAALEAVPVAADPIHMNDLQTFRLRYRPLPPRARSLWPKVRGNAVQTTLLASATFLIEMAETGMLTRATDELSVQGWVNRPLSLAAQMLDAAEAGRDYFHGRTGVLLKAYKSKLDGAIQPYILQVPEPLPGGRIPLVVVLHGWGAPRSIVNWGDPRTFAPWNEPYLRLQVYGRGWTRYKGVGTEDVFEVLDEVRRDFPVDPDRTYVTGGSMGGAGTWFLATHFPGLFAAAAPVCGYTDYRLDFGSTGLKAEWERRAYRAHDALTAAPNLENTPVYFIHGDQDLPGAFGSGVDVQHSRVMAARLKELGIPFEYDELPGVKHGVPSAQYQKAEKWLLSHRRNPDPPRVVFETSTLRYNRSYWVEVEGLERHFTPSRVEAAVRQGAVHITTRNITHLALDRRTESSAVIDGQSLALHPAADGRIHLSRVDGRWSLSRSAPTGLGKRHGLQGPWVDAFTGPALYVVPSSGGDWADLAAYDLETYQCSHGGLDCSNVRGRAEVSFAIRKADQVTRADIARHNLILFGDARSNALLARISGRLPIRATREGIETGARRFQGARVGAKFIYPNPLNPKCYVAVATGASAEALHSLRIFHWQIPDYLIFDENAVLAGGIPYYGAGPEHQPLLDKAYLAAGYFNEQWQFEGGEPSLA
ncbi:MAG: prolyl oligopeptidase family serine peptidase [Bryobacterales bacterium]|nr:prolyl oligopeptidase family serine peptidase [Bryobacterales bacterium]